MANFKFTGKCFRRGGASAMAAAGEQPATIKMADGWKGSSYLKYLSAEAACGPITAVPTHSLRTPCSPFPSEALRPFEVQFDSSSVSRTRRRVWLEMACGRREEGEDGPGLGG